MLRLISKRAGDTFFVDVYNAEFSRDADATKGGYTDNYYLQLVASIRRFKGARPVPSPEGHRHRPGLGQGLGISV